MDRVPDHAKEKHDGNRDRRGGWLRRGRRFCDGCPCSRDAGGVPGAVLEEKLVKDLETFGDCCTVAVDKLKKGVPVTAGTTYWVAAILPSKKTGSDVGRIQF